MNKQELITAINGSRGSGKSIRMLVDVFENNIKELEKQLADERKLNEEIKARFVKCNTCTQEMKDKCLMFTENLCEGERCEELVDLMALVEKNDIQTKYELLGERCNQLLKDKGDLTDRCDKLEQLLNQYVEDNAKVSDYITKLEQQIEKMRCCGNCEHKGDYKKPYEYTTGWCNICKRHKIAKGKIDKWELRK